MRILAYILETLVLAFIITALVFISKQEHIDEEKVKQEADSTSNVNLDKLNDPDYFNKKFEESPATDSVAHDSITPR